MGILSWLFTGNLKNNTSERSVNLRQQLDSIVGEYLIDHNKKLMQIETKNNNEVDRLNKEINKLKIILSTQVSPELAYLIETLENINYSFSKILQLLVINKEKADKIIRVNFLEEFNKIKISYNQMLQNMHSLDPYKLMTLIQRSKKINIPQIIIDICLLSDEELPGKEKAESVQLENIINVLLNNISMESFIPECGHFFNENEHEIIGGYPGIKNNDQMVISSVVKKGYRNSDSGEIYQKAQVRISLPNYNNQMFTNKY
jgi:hypothetical protein